MHSKHLRSPRTLVAVLLAIVLPLITFFATAGYMSIPPDSKGIDIVEGRDLFRAHCGSCHFATAGFPSPHGPNLFEIGKTGARRRPGMSAPAYILESILEPSAFLAPSSRPGMPVNVGAQLPPEKIRNIVGFLASRGASPDYEQIVALEIPDRRTPDQGVTKVDRVQMEQAVALMHDKAGCLKCHSIHHAPESKVYAPAVFNVGLVDKRRVEESVTAPHKEIKAGYHSASVVLQNGQVATGKLVSRDDDLILLATWDQQGNLSVREIPIDEVEEEDGRLLIEESPISIMPADFDKLLTREELESIFTVIHQLN